MLSWIREKFGTVVIGGIIGFIGFVFVFYGVFNPKSTRGLHEGAVAGTVNGDSITISEFNRAFNQRLEMFKSLGGNMQLTEEQIKMFRIRDGVFDQLARRKIMLQEAHRQKMLPSGAEVKERIQEIPAFQKDGRFDFLTYKDVLAANRYTPGSFERTMQDDLAVERLAQFFQARVQASDEEVRRQFLANEDKRNIKYVLLSTETGAKGVTVEPAAISAFLKDPAKQNLAKSQYEARKETVFKGKTFDAVKEQLAREILASEKTDEILKVNQKLAEQVTALLTADKASDAKVNALLKPYGAQVKTSGLIPASAGQIPGIGDSKDVVNDAFAAKSPIDPAQGGKAKSYATGPWIVVAVVAESQKPDMAKFDAEREKLVRQVVGQKGRQILENWIEELYTKAKIDKNPAVVGGEA